MLVSRGDDPRLQLGDERTFRVALHRGITIDRVGFGERCGAPGGPTCSSPR
jgi:hypothetical protein